MEVFVISDSKESLIVREYTEGKTMKELSNLYSLSVYQIRKLLQGNGIRLRNRSEIKKNIDENIGSHRVHSLNEDYFKTWSSNMSYILGFIYADGYVIYDEIERKYMLRFGLKTDDVELLLKIREELQYSGEIRLEKTNYQRVDGSSAQSYILAINSKKLVSSLYDLGLYRNKSLTKQFPDVPKEYLGDFLRGYFDGNGSVDSIGENIRVRFSSGSIEFLRSIEEILYEHGLKRRNIYTGKNERKNVHSLEYSSFTETTKIFSIFYKEESNLKLDRKYKRFKKLMNKKMEE